MREVKMLREQARLLRDLAARSSLTNGHGIREEVLALAERCEQWAEERERDLARGDAPPAHRRQA